MKLFRLLAQLFTKGARKYKCTDCQCANRVIPNADKITIGYCWNCQHPIWEG